MLFQFSAQLGLIAYYNIKRDYIAAELCENRDKPDACCAGKCYLSKQLGGLETKDSNTAVITEKDIPVCILPETTTPDFIISIQTEYCRTYAAPVSAGYLQTGFQPPEYAAV